MTAFIELPMIARELISLWFAVLLFLSCAATFRLLSQKSFLLAIPSCLVLLTDYILLQWCSNISICNVKKIIPPHSSVLMDGTGCVWLLLIGAFLTVLTVCFLLHTHRWRKTHLTPFSLKEGIDGLPSGLCWYYEDGVVALRNRVMEQLYTTITGGTLYDGNILKEALLCRMDEHSMMMLPDGTVWSIAFSTVKKDGILLFEICAHNMTEEYQTTLLLQEKQKQAQLANDKLTKYSRELAQMITAGEILSAKVRIHDELGQALLLTKKYLLCDGTEEDKKKLLYVLRKNNALMENHPSKSGKSYLEMIKEAAFDMGVTLVIEGKMPSKAEVEDIITTAIHENLTNTIRHAQGNEMRVELTNGSGFCTAVFVNNGKTPSGPIEERGGLKTLRTLVESAGGIMKIEDQPQYKMTLRFETEEAAERRQP